MNNYARWSPEETSFLINNYSIKPISYIIKELNRPLQSIYGKASSLKLKSFTDKSREWSDDEITFIQENYKEMTHQEIGNVLGRTKTAVDLKLNRLGLKKEKYTYDKTFFDKINTEEKAYWLGFIFADGYIHVDSELYQNELGIQLQIGDKNHLKKFNKSLNGNIEVNTRIRKQGFIPKGQEFNELCEIRLYSKQLVESINRYNLERKSFTKEFPDDLPYSLLPHFIRGYCDGNGAICISKNGHTYVSISCASENFINVMQDKLSLLGIKSAIRRSKTYGDLTDEHNGTIEEIDGVWYRALYNLNINTINDVLRFVSLLYIDNCHISLDRKQKKARKIYEILNNKIK